MLWYVAIVWLGLMAQRCLVPSDQYFAVISSFGQLQVVHLEYVPKNQMTVNAFLKVAQE